MNRKERNPIQLTNNGAENFGPYSHPNGKNIIFASNMDDPKKRNFELYMVDVKTKIDFLLSTVLNFGNHLFSC